MLTSRGMNGFFFPGFFFLFWTRGGDEGWMSVQHTSFPAAPAGRMLSWVS